MTRPGTMTRAGSIRAVRQAIGHQLQRVAGRWRGGSGLGPAGPRLPGRLRLMPGSTRRPTKSKSRRSGVERRRRAHPDGDGPRPESRPSGASKASSVNPAAAKSARMDGVRSGGRRCRVQTTWPPAAQNPGIAWMVRVMSAALMFPKTPQTSTRSAGTASAYQVGPARHRPRPPGPGRPRRPAARPSRAKATRAGSSSTSSAETRAPSDGSPRRRSRPAPGPRTGSRSGSAPAGIRGHGRRPAANLVQRGPHHRLHRPQPQREVRRRVLVGACATAPSANPRPDHPGSPAAPAGPLAPPASPAPAGRRLRHPSRRLSGWSPGTMTAHRRVVRRDRREAPMIKYLGSKRRLVPVLARICQASGATTALDLFTGTTRVAQAFKAQGVHVTAVDSARYAHAFARTYIETDAAATDAARAPRRPSPTSTPSPASRATSPRPSAVRPGSSNRTTPLGSMPCGTPSTRSMRGHPCSPSC